MVPLKPLIIFIALLTLSNLLASADLVPTACNSTLFNELCVSSLRSDPRSQSSNLYGLAEIALNISAVHGVQTLSYINQLKSNGGNVSDYVSKCLDDCIEEYNEAIESLQESIDALKNGDFDVVNTLVTTAMTDSDTCEEGFTEKPDEEAPLTKKNQKFSMLCSNFLAITLLVQG